MPKVLVVNPNTSEAMSREIRRTAGKVFQAPWSFEVRNAVAGPESLESWRDYAFASVAVMPYAETDADGILLACFGDPGLYSLKEMSRVPVLGIAEAAMSLALLLGGKFGILAGMDRAVSLMDSMVKTYGLEGRYAGTVPLSLRVLGFEDDREKTLAALESAGRKLAERGADVLLLGCAGLTGFREELMDRVPAVVVDPVEAGCRMLKSVVEGGLFVGRGGLYASPAPQKMNNLEKLISQDAEPSFKTWEQ